jgi:hypothetical protein
MYLQPGGCKLLHCFGYARARRVDVYVHLQAQAIDRIPLCLKSCAISTIAFVFAGLYSCP